MHIASADLIPLPIDPFVPRVIEALRRGRDVVLVAEPGAGKTTRIAPGIVRAGLLARPNDQLVMLQPRRVAARAAAGRIAEEQGWRLGDEVGYQVRFERMMSAHTPLRVLTEGILVRHLVADPELAGVGCVVLDEFHERSIHSDLSLAMLREAKAVRPDLRLIVMSATLDADAVADYLRAAAEVEEVEVLHVPGRLFPVEVEYAGDSPTRVEPRVGDVLRALWEGPRPSPWEGPRPRGPSEEITSSDCARSSSQEQSAQNRSPTYHAGASDGPRGRGPSQLGDVLVFLPGVREIERTMEAIARLGARHGYDVLPLHGSLTKEEQDRAVHFDPSSPPRVICATNIAETSLTLPGVRLVIDSGLVRQAGYDASRGLETLATVFISKASAEQRRGRAGRVAAGRCVRLWSKMTQHRLAEFDIPEIRRVDLSEAALAVRAWGGDPATFGWFEPPDARLLESAGKLLEMIGAVESGRLAPLGRALQNLPLHPRAARLLTAAPPALLRDAATVAALLGEGAEVPGRRTANIHELLEAFHHRKLDPAIGRAVERARDALLRIANGTASLGASPVALEELLLLAYPDRVCRRREGDPALARLVEGGGVRLLDPSAVRGDLFLALDVRQGTQAQKQQADVRLVAEIDESWLERDLPQNIALEEQAVYDEATGRVINLRRRRYRDLVLEEQRAGKPNWQDAEVLLRQRLATDAWRLVENDEVLGELYRRWQFVYRPTLSSDTKSLPLPSADELIWQACAGSTSREEVIARGRGLAQAALHDPKNPLETFAPREIEVPSGSRIRLDWSGTVIWQSGDMEIRPPVLKVRLQELFGLAQTPRVGPRPGIPVTLHLLGPNYRPVQITDDLPSFWKNTYPQVRKDLRARYPKHAWPEDPLSAQPVRGARRRSPAT